MAASGAVSGKNGNVKISATAITELTKWSFNPKANIPKYASNATSGYKKGVVGVFDGNGSMDGKWDAGAPQTATIDAGTSATLLLITTGSQQWSVPSLVADLKIEVDLDNGEIESWTASFESNGQWTNPSAV